MWTDSVHDRLHNLVTSRQQDKQTLATMEKKLTDERKLRAALEIQLASEKKNKSVEAAARAVAMATAARWVIGGIWLLDYIIKCWICYCLLAVYGLCVTVRLWNEVLDMLLSSGIFGICVTVRLCNQVLDMLLSSGSVLCMCGLTHYVLSNSPYIYWWTFVNPFCPCQMNVTLTHYEAIFI